MNFIQLHPPNEVDLTTTIDPVKRTYEYLKVLHPPSAYSSRINISDMFGTFNNDSDSRLYPKVNKPSRQRSTQNIVYYSNDAVSDTSDAYMPKRHVGGARLNLQTKRTADITSDMIGGAELTSEEVDTRKTKAYKDYNDVIVEYKNTISDFNTKYNIQYFNMVKAPLVVFVVCLHVF